MEKELITEMIEKLRSGQINEWYVHKDEFLEIRAVIVSLDDFKHFRGIAQRSGDVIYQYLQEPRS
ncbi:hypothetical protein [Robertmurraya korlensis]|uniref:hypothetical protein n=1 Tax=Robertmurraya korlensis TaxID=519977 RepID=UPI000826BE7C|nr:hypothetical protein [Robertmurraya korlensis]